jgi:hypothetical protein
MNEAVIRSWKAVTKMVYKVNPIISRIFELEINSAWPIFFGEIIVLPNNARPIRALAFKGRPPNSKFTSAMVMVKNRIAMISGFVTST